MKRSLSRYTTTKGQNSTKNRNLLLHIVELSIQQYTLI